MEGKPSAAQAVVEEVKQAEASEEQLAKSTLDRLRKVKAPTAAKKHNIGLKNLYHDSFFHRLLGMMDFYAGLAQVSPSALALVEQFADPEKLNLLVKFLIAGLSAGRLLILRIFQGLMKLDFPSEILDRAVEISCRKAKVDTPDPVDVKVAELVNLDTKLDLSQLAFFKMIYSMILKAQGAIWSESSSAAAGLHVVSLELARVFRSLSNNGERNIFNQKLI